MTSFVEFPLLSLFVLLVAVIFLFSVLAPKRPPQPRGRGPWAEDAERRCPTCGAEHPAYASYCPRCGKRI